MSTNDMQWSDNYYEPFKDASTLDEMRAEIFRKSRDCHLIRSVLDSARYLGLSGEDCYVMMAYHALRERQLLLNSTLRTFNTTLPQYIVTIENGKEVWGQ